MKKILCFMMFAICFASYSYGQTEKGDIMIDPSISFNIGGKNNQPDLKDYAGDLENKSFGLGFNPSAAYFVIDNLAIGVGLDYRYDRMKSIQTDPNVHIEALSNTNRFGLRVYGKYYFGKEKFRPFIGAGVCLGKEVQKLENYYKDFEGEDEYNRVLDSDYISYSLYPGLAYFINDNVSLDLMLKYAYNRKHGNGIRNGKQFDHQVSLDFGISIYL